ncbi:ABC transporter ATP-binding protein [Paenibacillus piscarius]|uniref:ABC transporter ATP-binding protein n=1 Tax=Paenibacillus piscarius TaxID=1089681 RepID=UPI001EE8D0F5|nr:ABC transporter ATP-binding protein [Paenibacillus piscarius]
MEQETAISVKEVSKVYRLYDKLSDRLKEAIHPFRKKYHTDFNALRDVSFEVKKGETIGIVGKNGSGKSTLLKMITGVLTPSVGEIEVNGRISALLELGAGFNGEYTGIENIHLNGTIMGYTKDEMDAKIEDIASFADIGEFIHQPVKMYSSGMFARLAFAVAINVDPDILIVDEALSVGDIRFQQKCYRKIEEFKQTKTVLMVTHDISAITKYCDRAIWINEGDLMADGHPIDVAKQYQAHMIGSYLNKDGKQIKSYSSGTSVSSKNYDNIDALNEKLDVLGDKKVEIIGMSLFDEIDSKVNIVQPGQMIKVGIKVKANDSISDPIVGFTIKDRLGTIIGQTNSFVLEQDISDLVEGGIYVYQFSFEVPYINHGVYTLSPALASGTQGNHVQHCWVHDALVFNVVQAQTFSLEGVLVLNDVEFRQII